MSSIAQLSIPRKVAIGVDTHKYIHVAVVLDELGGRLGELTVPADSGGYVQLERWAVEFGRVLAFGVEGTQPAHAHEDGRLGLYYGECPLAQLAAVHTDGWAPQPLAIASPAQVALSATVTSSGSSPRLSASLTDSRAPPLA